MTAYRKKPVVIEATQWFKAGDHPAVEPRPAEILFDRAGNYFYVSHADNLVPMANAWFAVNTTGDVAQKYGPVLPFAFYKVKSGELVLASEKPDLLKRYMAQQGWMHAPRDMGLIKTLERTHIVTPGDWIITGVKGEHYPCKPDIFAATYEAAEAES